MVELLSAYSNQPELLENLQKILNFPEHTHPDLPVRVPKQEQTRLREEQIPGLLTAYEGGATTYDLAERFNVHRSTVSQILERHGITPRYRKLTPDHIDQVIQLYQDGWSLARIGDRFEVNASTIWSLLKRRGIPRRDTQGK